MKSASQPMIQLLNRQSYALLLPDATAGVTLPAEVPLSTRHVTVECLLLAKQWNNFNDFVSNNWVNNGWLLFADSGPQLSFGVGQAGSQYNAVYNNPPAGQIMHVCGIYDGAAIRLYVNGAQVGIQTLVGATLDTGHAITVNGQPCIIDALHIWRRALSADEVAARAQGVYKSMAGLVGRWGFNEGSGTTAYDASGYGNDGTLSGAASYTDHLVPENQGPLRIADLYTVTLQDGTVARYTSADIDITIGGNTFAHDGPRFKRGTLHLQRGVQVDNMSIDVYPQATDTIGGSSWLQAAANGTLDGARVLIERFASDSWQNTAPGTVYCFGGREADSKTGRSGLQLTVHSDVELLNVPMPRNLFIPSCINTLYDPLCKASKEYYSASGTVAAVASGRQFTSSGIANGDGYYDLGQITFTSGALSGRTFSVKSYLHSGGTFKLFFSTPVLPAVGDAFTAYAGCDKQLTTCTNKFNNVVHFRGTPFVPQSETAY